MDMDAVTNNLEMNVFTETTKDLACRICFTFDHVQDAFQSSYNDETMFEIVNIVLKLSRVSNNYLEKLCINCFKTVINVHLFLQKLNDRKKFWKKALSSLKTKSAQSIAIPIDNDTFYDEKLLRFDECDIKTAIKSEDVSKSTDNAHDESENGDDSCRFDKTDNDTILKNEPLVLIESDEHSGDMLDSYDNDDDEDDDYSSFDEEDDLPLKRTTTNMTRKASASRLRVRKEFSMADDDSESETKSAKSGASKSKREAKTSSISPAENAKKRVLCQECGKMYSHKIIKHHMMLHKTPKPYQCEHCPFKCSQRGNLSRHMRGHTGEKPYLCNICGHSTIQKDVLTMHMKIHQRLEKPVSCTLCSSEFFTRYEYRQHRLIHRDEIEPMGNPMVDGGVTKVGDPEAGLTCPICQKQFQSKYGFVFHVRAHKEGNRFKCKVCDNSFTFETSLKDHMRVHTGEKPYSCTLCPKRFKQHGHLKTHLMIHENKREHRCEFCDKTFNIKFNLLEHRRIHTGEKIECVICGKSFRQYSNHRKHMREMHKPPNKSAKPAVATVPE